MVDVIPGQRGEFPEETKEYRLVRVGGREPAPEAGGSRGPPGGGDIGRGMEGL